MLDPLHIPEKLLKPLREQLEEEPHFPLIKNELFKTKKIADETKHQPLRGMRPHPDEKTVINLIKTGIESIKKNSGAKLTVKEKDFIEKSNKTKSKFVKNISNNQLKQFFFDIIEFHTPSKIFEYLQKISLLEWILPELSKGYGVMQNKYHKYDIFYHNIYACDFAPRDKTVIRIAALFHDLGKVAAKREKNGEGTFYGHELISTRICARFLEKIQLPEEDSSRILHLVRFHMFHYTPLWTESALRRFYRSVGPDLINDLMTLRLADRKANGIRTGIPDALFKLKERLINLLEKDQEFATKDLKISGRDLINLFQLKPGPLFGKILKGLADKVKAGTICNDREILIKEAGERIMDLKKLTALK